MPSTALEISLVVPAHNRPDALERMLASLAGQTLDHNLWEVIVVDDGSCERAARRIADLVARAELPNCRLLRLPKGGPARARNAGVREADAPIILFLNDDVILTPRHLRCHVDFHRDNPEPNVAAHMETRWHPDVVHGPVMRCLRETVFNYDVPIAERERAFVWFMTSSLSAKRSLLVANPFNESFPDASFEDTELAVRLIGRVGLRVELLRESPALHWHYHSWLDYLRRCRMNGVNAARLLKLVPDFEHRLVQVLDAPRPRRRLARAFGRALRGDLVGFWRDAGDAVYLRSLWRTRVEATRTPNQLFVLPLTNEHMVQRVIG